MYTINTSMYDCANIVLTCVRNHQRKVHGLGLEENKMLASALLGLAVSRRRLTALLALLASRRWLASALLGSLMLLPDLVLEDISNKLVDFGYTYVRTYPATVCTIYLWRWTEGRWLLLSLLWRRAGGGLPLLPLLWWWAGGGLPLLPLLWRRAGGSLPLLYLLWPERSGVQTMLSLSCVACTFQCICCFFLAQTLWSRLRWHRPGVCWSTVWKFSGGHNHRQKQSE